MNDFIENNKVVATCHKKLTQGSLRINEVCSDTTN